MRMVGSSRKLLLFAAWFAALSCGDGEDVGIVGPAVGDGGSGGDLDADADTDTDADSGADECRAGGEAKSSFMPLHEQAIDLDTGTLFTCLDADCSADPDVSAEPWDFMFVGPEVRLLPHGEIGVEAAYLGTFASTPPDEVSDCDIADASWSDEVIEQDLGGNAVLLVRTDQGAVFKIAYWGLEDYPEWDAAYGFSYTALQDP